VVFEVGRKLAPPRAAPAAGAPKVWSVAIQMEAEQWLGRQGRAQQVPLALTSRRQLRWAD